MKDNKFQARTSKALFVAFVVFAMFFIMFGCGGGGDDDDDETSGPPIATPGNYTDWVNDIYVREDGRYIDYYYFSFTDNILGPGCFATVTIEIDPGAEPGNIPIQDDGSFSIDRGNIKVQGQVVSAGRIHVKISWNMYDDQCQLDYDGFVEYDLDHLTIFCSSHIDFARIYSENRAYNKDDFPIDPASPYYNGQPYYIMNAAMALKCQPPGSVKVSEESTIGYRDMLRVGKWGTAEELYVSAFPTMEAYFWGGPYPAPGPSWENKTYSFSPGGVTRDVFIPQGSLRSLSIPVVAVSGDSAHPTFTWGAVDGADHYQVVILDMDDKGMPDLFHPVFVSNGIPGTTFTYSGDAFEEGAKHAVMVRARELHPDASTDPDYQGVVLNQSAYLFLHDPTI